MNKTFMLLASLLLCIVYAKAQVKPLNNLLEQIENNNKTLKALRSRNQSKIHEYKAGNQLPDLQTSMYYLPFGKHASPDYSEFEISQSFAFPSVYALRSQWIDMQEVQRQHEYDRLRQQLLLKAQKLGYKLIFFHQLEDITRERQKQAEQMFKLVKTSHEKGETGILSYNKAKISRIDDDFRLEEVLDKQARVRNKLKALNGDQEVTDALPDTMQSTGKLTLPPRDSLWQQKLSKDPEILALKQSQKAARKKLTLEKHKRLPDISAGFNYQGVRGNNYSGFYGGLSIPLWSGGQRIKMAESKLNYTVNKQKALLTNKRQAFNNAYNRYQTMWNKYEEYRKTLAGINSRELLLKAYQAGEISFREYYREVQFYRKAENRMLEMKKQLYQLKATLFQHQL